jgi:hypothetical protein
MTLVGRTRKPSFSQKVEPGASLTYRVAVVANYLNLRSLGSAVSISPPLDVRP